MIQTPTPHKALAAFGCDKFELGLLTVSRHFVATFRAPTCQCWQHGYTIAIELWGETVGLATANKLSKVMRALTRCRADTLHFHDPYDIDNRDRVTADEVALLKMLHHMRRDEVASAREAVCELTDGLMDPQLIRAGLAFAHRFPAGTTGPAAVAPKLALVH